MLDLLNEVINISILAGKEILKYYKNVDLAYVIKKEDNSPLSQADLKANEIIISSLQKISNLQINSEERILSFDKRKDMRSFWLVDPLDGTKDFLNKSHDFSVNIALIANNKPVLGVVYAPAKDELFYALKGAGAFFKSKDLLVDLSLKQSQDKKMIRAAVSNFHLNSLTKDFLNTYELSSMKAGSSLKMCYLASGCASVYPRFNASKEWDIASSDIILQESGGKILWLDKQNKINPNFSYNKEDVSNPYFIACSKDFLSTNLFKKIEADFS